MHSRTIDAARTAACWREDATDDPLSPARGIALALIASVPVWALLGMLAALAWRWS